MTSDPEYDDEPPLVTQRLRRLGWLVLLLVPLLVISLATVRIPRGYALVLFIAGVAAVAAWRERRSSGEE